ncbi:hypothetical protein K461DRAFT_275159 [Myriangium duriaei CBS 260.36]|uniref:Uncharacterized protein n=1 Tax=Myriangium duriaei CBS 260.36 TaxID=1168546 RepID=A0A9P4J712_9PEZI|nr:hypothetical protein K461DRAFT_275159 [Myriangium duriaei CBS 260.36]
MHRFRGRPDCPNFQASDPLTRPRFHRRLSVASSALQASPSGLCALLPDQVPKTLCTSE